MTTLGFFVLFLGWFLVGLSIGYAVERLMRPRKRLPTLPATIRSANRVGVRLNAEPLSMPTVPQTEEGEMNMTTDDLIQTIQKLVLDEGDIVVIKPSHDLTLKQSEMIEERVARVLKAAGRKVEVLMLPKGFEIELLKASTLPKGDA